MAGAAYKDRDGNVIERGEGKTSNLTVSLYAGDHELVEWMVEYLGSNKSDVVRTAVRSMAAHLAHIEGSRVTRT